VDHINIAFIIGTRPELIKVAPVILEMKKRRLDKYFEVINTAQHKDLLEPFWDTFGIKPDVSLDIMRAGQNLTELTSRALLQIQDYINSKAKKPQIIFAQGDTTTVLASSMVAFYNHIKFVHLEAGLRSFNLLSPFPEEFNRKVASITAHLHLAPTERSKSHLIKEGIDESTIKVVGNTVVDALEYIKNKPTFLNHSYDNQKLRKIPPESKKVLITCHRRENHGKNLEKIIQAVDHLMGEHTDTYFIWVSHPNPKVKQALEASNITSRSNAVLIPPVNYFDLLKLIDQAQVILSDSGGIQEEAPSFGTPVIVMRENSERMEGVEQKMAVLAGSDKSLIIKEFNSFLNNSEALNGQNPYGDGKASQRIVDLLMESPFQI
jgi:UDP-N-acetylglucosamine 2-epimerase (non-hydrolysing)